MLAESRDLSVATYSEDCVTGCGLMTSTFTCIAGGGPCGPCGLPLQAESSPAAAMLSSISQSLAVNTRGFLENIVAVWSMRGDSLPLTSKQTKRIRRSHRRKYPFHEIDPPECLGKGSLIWWELPMLNGG